MARPSGLPSLTSFSPCPGSRSTEKLMLLVRSCLGTLSSTRLRTAFGVLALVLGLGALSVSAPALAAGKAAAAPADEAPAITQSEPAAQPAGKPAPVIAIVPRISPAERAQREREEARRRERVRPRVIAWSRAYRPAVA